VRYWGNKLEMNTVATVFRRMFNFKDVNGTDGGVNFNENTGEGESQWYFFNFFETLDNSLYNSDYKQQAADSRAKNDAKKVEE
jgi:hypothetical protein